MAFGLFEWEDFDVDWNNEGHHWYDAVFLKVTVTVTVSDQVIIETVEEDVDPHIIVTNEEFIEDVDSLEPPSPPVIPPLSIEIGPPVSDNITLTVENIVISDL